MITANITLWGTHKLTQRDVVMEFRYIGPPTEDLLKAILNEYPLDGVKITNIHVKPATKDRHVFPIKSKFQ
jgi:hypothetical protein